MTVDYHIHSICTPIDVDKDMTIPNIAQTAKEKGLEKIAITDHFILEGVYYDSRIPIIYPKQIDQYIEECRKVEEKTGTSIKPGLEVDYSSEFEKEIRELLTEYRDDMGLVVGSIHFLELGDYYSHIGIAESDSGMHTQKDYLDLIGEKELWKNYFDKQIEAVKSGLFDVLAHPDLPKKTGLLSFDFDDYRKYAEPLIDELLNQEVIVEINTSGLRAPVKELLPGYPFLKTLKEKASKKGEKPKVSIGSDAHSLEDIGRDLDEAIYLANTMGFDILS